MSRVRLRGILGGLGVTYRYTNKTKVSAKADRRACSKRDLDQDPGLPTPIGALFGGPSALPFRLVVPTTLPARGSDPVCDRPRLRGRRSIGVCRKTGLPLEKKKEKKKKKKKRKKEEKEAERNRSIIDRNEHGKINTGVGTGPGRGFRFGF